MTKESMIYQLLDELKISYDRLDHEPISSVIEAVEKGIVLPGQQVKNLFLKVTISNFSQPLRHEQR